MTEKAIQAATALMLAIGLTACQPDDERPAVPAGAIPAADDARPGSETAPSGVMMPGAVSDTADAPLPEVDTLPQPIEVSDTPGAGPGP